MPTMVPIVLTDSDAIAHSFAPRGKDPQTGVALLVKSTGVPVGDERLAISRTRTPQGREKVSFKLTIPVVATETIGGVDHPSVVRTAYADVTLSFDSSSTTDERSDVRFMVADLLGNSEGIALALIDNLDHLY